MKIVRYIYLFISIALVLFIGLYIVGCWTSYYYDIRYGSSEINKQFAGGYLLELIDTLWVFGGYVMINIIYLIVDILIHKKKTSSK